MLEEELQVIEGLGGLFRVNTCEYVRKREKQQRKSKVTKSHQEKVTREWKNRGKAGERTT
jgi:hypothetical protein